MISFFSVTVLVLNNKYFMFKKCFILILFIVASFLIVPRTEADICKFWSGHQVCVIRIKRSAKYYWKYRTILSVDNKKQPEIVYDCRLRSGATPLAQLYPKGLGFSDRGNAHQETREFEDNDDDLGDFVCSLFNK